MGHLYRYTSLAAVPLGFFAILAVIQYAIVANSNSQRLDRQQQPYMNGQPLPTVRQKIDRRPQSITLPGGTMPSKGERLPSSD